MRGATWTLETARSSATRASEMTTGSSGQFLYTPAPVLPHSTRKGSPAPRASPTAANTSGRERGECQTRPAWSSRRPPPVACFCTASKEGLSDAGLWVGPASARCLLLRSQQIEFANYGSRVDASAHCLLLRGRQAGLPCAETGLHMQCRGVPRRGAMQIAHFCLCNATNIDFMPTTNAADGSSLDIAVPTFA